MEVIYWDVLEPTGSYPLGFVPAAMLTGWLSERGWDQLMLIFMPGAGCVRAPAG